MPSDRAAYADVAQKLGLNPDTVRRWVKADARAPLQGPIPARVVDGPLTARSARDELNRTAEDMVRTSLTYIDALQRAVDPSSYADASIEDLRQAFAAITGSEPRTPSNTDFDDAALPVQAAAQLKTTVTQAAHLDEMVTHMIYVAHHAGIPIWDIAAAAGLTVSKVRHRIDKRDEQIRKE